MSSQWLYSRDGTDHGPVSSAELMELAKNGQLLPTDLLWKEGMAEWKPASTFPKLFSAQTSADETPVFVVTKEKPKTTPQSRGGTVKEKVLLKANANEKAEGLDPSLVGLAIFFLPPLGLYLLWRHPVLKHRTKWWVSACGWLLFVLFAGASDDSEMQSDARAYARLDKRVEVLTSLADACRSNGDRKAYFEQLAKLKPIGEEMLGIRDKYRSSDRDKEFMEAVEEIKDSLE